MGRLSLKTLLYAVFCAAGVICLSACAEPVDLAAFAQDKDVLNIIDSGTGIVNISPGSDTGLVPGNKRIGGLIPGKYYMVEEWNERGDFMGVQFVRESGARSKDLANIGVASEKEIIGLTNFNHYRVKSALSLPDMTFPGPEDNSYIVYTFPSPAPPPSDSIAEVPVFPVGSSSAAKRQGNGDIITLIGKGTMLDYVFFGTIESAQGVAYNFNVMRVSSVSGPTEPGAFITVTLSFTGDKPPQLGAAPIPYPQGEGGTIPFTVSNASQYDNYATTGITWYIDGEQVGTGQSFSLIKDDDKYTMAGTYIITVVASQNGIPYAAAIMIEVTALP